MSCQDVKTSWPINRVITNNPSPGRSNDESTEALKAASHRSAPEIKRNQQKLRGTNACFPNDCWPRLRTKSKELHVIFTSAFPPLLAVIQRRLSKASTSSRNFGVIDIGVISEGHTGVTQL